MNWKMSEYFITSNPRKHFCNVKPSEYVAPTMLATDYKSPPLIIKIEK